MPTEQYDNSPSAVAHRANYQSHLDQLDEVIALREVLNQKRAETEKQIESLTEELAHLRDRRSACYVKEEQALRNLKAIGASPNCPDDLKPAILRLTHHLL
jgi:chromosome segregation ATPase